MSISAQILAELMVAAAARRCLLGRTAEGRLVVDKTNFEYRINEYLRLRELEYEEARQEKEHGHDREN